MPRARKAQTTLCEIGLCEVDVASHLVSLTVADGSRVVLDVVRALDAAQLAPETLAVREPTLDDVFLSLTGHKAEEPAEAERTGAATEPTRDRGAA